MDKYTEKVQEAFKDNYLKACDEAAKKGIGNDVYNVAKLRALCQMAKHDIYPDERFSDVDFNVWSMFREIRLCTMLKTVIC